ncbi:MAG: hypothetical protein IKI68_02975 [Clostridia bacterium]|nr:hypothetical protein [Clostridia bacterium]
MKKIRVSDHSLRSLTASGPLLFREKTAIVASVDNFGADAIELPPIANYKEDEIVYKTISSAVRNCEICLPVGFDETKIKDAFDCIKNAEKPCLQIEVPVSTVTMEYTYHIKADKMLKKVEALCREAAKYCKNIEFVALDATRAEVSYLVEIIGVAKAAGATAATVCDDAGIMTPKGFEKIVAELKEKCGLPIYVKVSNALNMANATALYAIEAGADGIKTAITGDNELKTVEIARVLEAEKERLGISFGLKTSELKSDIKELKKVVIKTEKTEKTENDGVNILLDSESTVSDVEKAAAALGYELSPEDGEKVYKALVRVLQKKTVIGAKELEAIVASSASQVPSTYHLESYNISSSNITTSMANVILTKGDTRLNGIATGDGPIDAAFFAIEQCVGYHYELDAFEIQAVTEGKEALGSTVVRLRSEGKLYSGTGLSTDIVGASIRAYINALNKIVYEEGLA